jgi:hypothetical protein
MAGPPSCYRNAGPAEERFGELARRYAAALDESDELAGTALEALDALGAEGMEALEAALDGDSASAPEALQRLLADVEQPPFAVDQDQLELGARAIMRPASPTPWPRGSRCSRATTTAPRSSRRPGPARCAGRPPRCAG